MTELLEIHSSLALSAHVVGWLSHYQRCFLFSYCPSFHTLATYFSILIIITQKQPYLMKLCPYQNWSWITLLESWRSFLHIVI